ncbi:hypothetical protein CEXT_413941 [Caerostris extrusa]|uniref:Uncharacterized protein n=1 Tax=Caerostris extrusa TaxID=172846 RepID=A0AAV4RGZ7_CAEEX|nr:hypothetical protein CEXT_413941 [Caerostris extrusa]
MYFNAISRQTSSSVDFKTFFHSNLCFASFSVSHSLKLLNLTPHNRSISTWAYPSSSSKNRKSLKRFPSRLRENSPISCSLGIVSQPGYISRYWVVQALGGRVARPWFADTPYSLINERASEGL